MSDPFKTTTRQETEILNKIKERQRAKVFTKEEIDVEPGSGRGKKKKEKEKEPTGVSELYNIGVDLLKQRGFILELTEGGQHVNHRILKPRPAPHVEGIEPPANFKPLQDINQDDFPEIGKAFQIDLCGQEVIDFWSPLFKPRAGDSPLLSYTDLLLQMRKIDANKNIHQILNYGHTFDPAGRLGGEAVLNPRIWVPDRDWFNPALHKVKFSDVFTIFPEAEQEILQLILGRVGVGRSNHLPPGRTEPVDHTARMAGVIVGKDAGLGKSTLFNGLTAALQRCGFVTHTFKSTEDRFGLKAAALSDIAYKDDTSLASLKKFLSAEETKILITNG